MRTGREERVIRALKDALAAHSVYETTVLGGVYDDAWADWYATHLVDHGVQSLLPDGDTIDASRLAAILRQLDVDYRQEQPAVDWPEYYAAHLIAMPE